MKERLCQKNVDTAFLSLLFINLSYVFKQSFIECMVAQRGCFSQYHQFHAYPCYRHVHSAQIVQKADLPFFIGTYQTDKNHVPFLSLKSVDGIDCYQAAVGA